VRRAAQEISQGGAGPPKRGGGDAGGEVYDGGVGRPRKGDSHPPWAPLGSGPDPALQYSQLRGREFRIYGNAAARLRVCHVSTRCLSANQHIFHIPQALRGAWHAR
jgi:hypothetical protein